MCDCEKNEAELKELREERTALVKAMQPIIDTTAPTPPLLLAVEAMALGSRAIFDANKNRIAELEEALKALRTELEQNSRTDAWSTDAERAIAAFCRTTLTPARKRP